MKTTKNEIQRTAERLFREKGFTNVSVDDICEELGITKGSFYHHYKSKYDPIIDRAKEQLQNADGMIESLQEVSSLKEQLWRIYRWAFYDMYDFISRDDFRNLWMTNIQRGPSGISPEIYVTSPGLFNHIIKLIKNAQANAEIANASSPTQIFQALYYAGVGFSVKWSAGVDDRPFISGLLQTFNTILG